MAILHHHDDKKQKHQSHEVHFSHSDCGVDCYGHIDLTGYGADRSEAHTNFISGAEALKEQLQLAIDQAHREQESL